MNLNITVPELGESVTEATVAKWFKSPGEAVSRDEPLVELETDKIALEINAASAGVLEDILVPEGEDVEVGAILGHLTEGAAAKANGSNGAASVAAPAVVETPKVPETAAEDAMVLSPAVRKLVEENDLDPSAIVGTGKDGRILKGDVLSMLEAPTSEAPMPEAPAVEARTAPVSVPVAELAKAEREERVPMSRLRQRVAERLKMAQDTTAMLTTFNEVDMSQVMAAR